MVVIERGRSRLDCLRSVFILLIAISLQNAASTHHRRNLEEGSSIAQELSSEPETANTNYTMIKAEVCDKWPQCVADWFVEEEKKLRAEPDVNDAMKQTIAKIEQNNCSRTSSCKEGQREQEIEAQIKQLQESTQGTSKGAASSFLSEWMERATLRKEELPRIEEAVFGVDLEIARRLVSDLEVLEGAVSQLHSQPGGEGAGGQGEGEYEREREAALRVAWQQEKSMQEPQESAQKIRRKAVTQQNCLLKDTVDMHLINGRISLFECPAEEKDCASRCRRYCSLVRDCRVHFAVDRECFTSADTALIPLLNRIPGSVGGFMPEEKLPAGGSGNGGGPAAQHSAGHKLCVVVPYRDGCGSSNQGVGRIKNLQDFVAHTPSFLRKRGVPDLRLIVVEQTKRGLFNKGVLFNSGAKQAEAIGCDYMVMNDVDQIPVGDNLKHEFPSQPTHLCTETDQEKFKLYETMVGGALLLSLEQYKKLNGYSNLYFGWGQEDDDMYERIRAVYKKVLHFKKGKYHALSHARVKDLDVTSSFRNNSKHLREMRKSAGKLLQDDGYKQIDKYSRVVKIVEVSRADPPYTKGDMDVIAGEDYTHILVDVVTKEGKLLDDCDKVKARIRV